MPKSRTPREIDLPITESSTEIISTITTSDIPDLSGTYLKLDASNDPMTDDLSMGDHKITDLEDPEADQDAATKNYVDIGVAASTWAFFLSDNGSDIGGYYTLFPEETGESASTLVSSPLGVGDGQLLWSFATESEQPSLEFLSLGVYTATFFALASGNKTARLYWQLYKRNALGSETLLMTSEESNELSSSLSQLVLSASVSNDIDLDTSDRLILKLFANVSGSGNDVTVTLYCEGDYNSRVALRVAAAAFSHLFVRKSGDTMTGTLNLPDLVATSTISISGQGSSNGLFIGGDTQLYRDASNVLRTPDSLVVDQDLTVDTIMSGDAASAISIFGGFNQVGGYIELYGGDHATDGGNVNIVYYTNAAAAGRTFAIEAYDGSSWATALELTANRQLRLPAQGSAAGILLGGDAQLYRSAANILRTPGALVVDDDLAVDTDTLFVDASADKVGINAGTDLSTYGALGVRTGADDRKGITVRRNSGSQTANLWEVQDEGGTALIQVNEAGDLESANFQSGIKGWQIAHDGDVEFANAWIRGELHCTVFVKDLIEAHAGTLGIFKSSGKLAADFTTPAVDGTTYIYITDPPGGGFLFSANDWVRIKSEYVNGVYDVWGVVTNPTDMGDGTQRYTYTHKSGSVGVTIQAGVAVADYGQSGQGYLLATADLNYAPYLDVVSWEGADPFTGANHTAHVRLGQLDGLAGLGAQYGLWAGKDSDHYVLLSDQNAIIHGLKQQWVDASDNVRGEVLPTASGSDILFWLGPNSSDPRFRVDANGVVYIGSDDVPADDMAGWAYPTDTTKIDGGDIYANTVTASALLAHGANWLGNPGFETGDLSSWDPLAGSIATYNPHNGKYSIVATGSSGSEVIPARQTGFAVEEGRKYYFGVWVRNSTGTGSAGCYITWRDKDGSVISYSQAYSGASTSWTKKEAVVTAPTGATTAWFVLTIRAGNTANVYFDDAEFYLADGRILVGSPGGARVEIDNDGLKAYDATTQRVNIASDGTFWFGNASGDNRIEWNGSALIVQGQIYVTGGDAAKTDMSNVDADTVVDKINLASTLIEPGRILISGSTSLDDWRHSEDYTLIDGGKIYAHSITANKINVRGHNAVANSGFETGDTTEWRIRELTPTVDDTVAHSGGYSLKATGDGVNGYEVVDTLPIYVEEGRNYYLAAWVRNSTGTGGAGARVKWYDRVGSVIGSLTIVSPASTSWEKKEVVTTAPNGVRYARVALNIDSDNAATVYFDDVEFYPCDGQLTVGIPGGARIEISSSELAGYSDATTKEFYIEATTGKAMAGGGAVELNSKGIKLQAGWGFNDVRAIKWGSDILDDAVAYIAQSSGPAGGEGYLTIKVKKGLNYGRLTLEADDIRMLTNDGSSDALFIDPDGHVGVGTYSPAVDLDVWKNAVTRIRAKRDGIGSIRLEAPHGAPYVGRIIVATGADIDKTAIYMTLNGKVGIGNFDPEHQLDVSGNVNCSGAYFVNGVRVVYGRYVNSAFDIEPDTTYGDEERRLLSQINECLKHHGLAAAS